MAAEQWEGLTKLLGSAEILEALLVTALFDLHRYWAQIEAASPFRMVDVYLLSARCD